MNKKVTFFIVFLSIITTYKSYIAYSVFSENNAPVYDGVMNESSQIKSYMRFKDNFSLVERYNQMIYEFEGNALSAGFSCFIALLNPNWFVNDGDIILRSFFSVLIFSLVLFQYLKRRTTLFTACLILLLIFQLPLFYHYRYGLTTYVPEIPAALFLLAGFIQFLNFFNSEKLVHCYSALLLVVMPIMFRFNFFVYAFFFMIPLLYKSYMIVRNKSKKEIGWMVGFVFCLLTFCAYYIYSHLPFFLSYYGSAISSKIPYMETTIFSSFDYLFLHVGEELGVLGVLTLFYILLLANENKFSQNSRSEGLFLAYPFISFFSFIILYLYSSNVPHIIAAMVVFSFSVFLIPFYFIQKISEKMNLKIVRYGAMLLIIILNSGYVKSFNAFSLTLPENATHRNVIDFIARRKDLNSNFKYIGFYDELIENQVDVAVYNETGIWLNSRSHFYIHDLFLSSISPKLKPIECAKFYTDKIESERINFIFINSEVNKPMSFQKVAGEVDKLIYLSLMKNKKYQVVKTFKSSYHGDVLVFKRKIGLE